MYEENKQIKEEIKEKKEIENIINKLEEIKEKIK